MFGYQLGKGKCIKKKRIFFFREKAMAQKPCEVSIYYIKDFCSCIKNVSDSVEKG